MAPHQSLHAQQALLNLERSQVPPVQLLSEAARIGGVDMRKLKLFTNKDFGDIYVQNRIHRFAPKEEWVLRWLLKQTKFLISVSEAQDINDHVQMSTCPETWLLLRYLVMKIPAKRLARILRENRVLDIMNASIENTFNSTDIHLKDAMSDCKTSPEIDNKPQHDLPRGVKRKRELDSSFEIARPTESASKHQALSVFGNICGVTSHCVGLCQSKHHDDKISSQHMRMALRGTSQLSASLVGKLVAAQAMMLISIGIADLDMVSDCLQCTQSILKLWDFRLHGGSSPDNDNNDQLFVQHCLKPSLVLIKLVSRLQYPRPQKSTVVSSLEQLIALHAIYPARALFFEELTAHWKPTEDPIAKDDLQIVTTRLGECLSLNEKGQVSTVGSSPIGDESVLYPLLFEIAVRATPHASVRQRQHEQGWLEAMLTALIQASHAFMNSSGSTMKGDELPNDDYFLNAHSPKCLVDLLDVALSRKTTLSLPILSHLAAHWLKDRSEFAKWQILARIIKMDVNIFIPNSGISTAQTLLSNLCETIAEAGTEGKQHYELIRDEIIIPLMHGFSHARALKPFVDLWRQILENTLSHQGTVSSEPSGPEPFQVWQDEDVIAAFIKLAETAATPTFVEKLLMETVDRMHAAGTRPAEMTEISAHALIIDAILASRWPKSVVEVKLTEELLEVTCTSLKQTPESHHARWRLWRVLRRCVVVLPSASTLANIMDPGAENSSAYVSLGSVNTMRSSQDTLGKQSLMLEALECFHLLVVEAAKDPAVREQLTGELTILNSHLLTVAERSEHREQSCAHPWDGHARSMNGLTELVTACLGIVLQYITVVFQAGTHNDMTLYALLCCSCRMSDSQLMQGWTASFFTIVQALLSSEELTSNTKMMHEISDGIFSTFGNDLLSQSTLKILHSMPLQYFSKAQLAKVADRLVEHIGSVSDSNDLDATERETALVSKIVQSANVSVGMPQQWSRLAELGENLHRKCDARNSRSYQSIGQGIQRIFNSMWKHALGLASAEQAKEMFVGMFTYCQKIFQSPRFRSVPLPSFIVSRGIINGFWADREKLSHVVSEDDLRRCREQYFEGLIAALSTLCESKEPDELMFDEVECLIQSLSQCSDLCRKITKLKDALTNIIKAMEGLKASQRAGPSTELSRFRKFCMLERNQQRLVRLVRSDDDGHLLEDETKRALLSFADFVGSLPPRMTTEALQRCLQRASDSISSLGIPNVRELLHLLRDGKSASPLGPSCLFLIGALLSTMKTTRPTAQPDAISDMVELTEALSASLGGSTQHFCLSVDCIKMVLDDFPGFVSQWTIDNLLASINVMLSQSAPHIEGPEYIASMIFGRLCSLVGVLLSQHRKRLGGRYHLLLPTIQGLMSCLFANNVKMASYKHNNFTVTLPSWIQRDRDPLDVQAATQFTRLLSSICDPTASSVQKTKHRAGSDLIDETNEAKSIAGQYMQFVIIHYARCQLEGVISPDVKAALMPGLYSIMNVMSLDGMRGMNAAMDASSRAIFKGLYDDFQKFGKWNQS